MSRTKIIKDAYGTVRIYMKDFKRLHMESKRREIPVVKIIQELVATLDNIEKK